MKLTSTIYLLLFIFVSSCSNGQTKKQVSKFKNILGNENYNTLTTLAADFEKDILKKTYPNLTTEKAYRKFLVDVKENKLNFWNEISSKNKETFKASSLRLEIYEFPDSVWIEEKDIKSRYIFKNDDGSIYRNDDGTIRYGISFHSVDKNKNLDSIIQREYEIPRIKYSGKYLEAIKAIKGGNKFLETFYDIKETFGSIHPASMAKSLLENKPDFSSEIVKGLIVIEFGY